MFGSIGPAELILIFIIALLVFGPKKLPEIGRSVGKALREFKKTSEEIKGRINDEIEASEINDIRKDIQSGVDDLRSGVRTLTSDLAAPPDEAAKDKDGETKKASEAHETGEGQKVT
ncbi:MAG TPA: Sec-independent protein translocase protein TatB [Candidatus Aminicenantes bacterium]|nr:Sec-independent protein translocase protein TatB [Candidatus Aminicenantes bacterium]HRY64278.1 Sec-independent protein translocase protein TatB [Candidatus Aminicenantes bacterium]HRZ71191.1 Sec-independent protein translocase protein TatB [Candidatus Aminicenantes bacterium]